MVWGRLRIQLRPSCEHSSSQAPPGTTTRAGRPPDYAIPDGQQGAGLRLDLYRCVCCMCVYTLFVRRRPLFPLLLLLSLELLLEWGSGAVM